MKIGVGCGGQFQTYSGTFASPSYPDNARNNSDCRWDIIVPSNLRVVLHFDGLY